MAVERDKLGAASLAIAATCFIALAISIRLIKLFFINPKRKKSCYLNAEHKPQHAFKRVLADNSYSQFKHLKLHTADSQSDEELLNLHPYKNEISKLMKNPNLGFLGFLEGREKGNFEIRGSHVWVETETQLKELVEVLSNESVFGVDTEQHSFRSFLGFTALIQISTTREDYLVDTIILHDVMGLLRPVFANPGICKVAVFHGADNDVLWLQRDFHIYVVNLFDTTKACDILSKPQRSLAYLLETYCSVSTNKLLQREDWRQRPLPEEMIHYARADAHYLLTSKLEDQLRFPISYFLNILKKISSSENPSPGEKFHFLLEASRRSNATCLQLFAKDIEAGPGELAASSIVSRCLNDQGHISSSLCDAKFQELVRRLCLWRDIMVNVLDELRRIESRWILHHFETHVSSITVECARLHDESLRFVLSENAIIALASEIPATEIDIFRCISKADQDLKSPSPLVCCHSEDLICLLRQNAAVTENIFQNFIHQHLGSTGSCPLSAYNYALLSKTSLGLNHTPTSSRNGFRASKQVAKKASRQLFVQKFSCKSPVYHNCKIYANDGRLLCYCDRRKLEWYVNRNLAKLVEDDPLSITLLFEPKGRPEDEDNDFYIQSKKNICVGCGEGNHYLRYRIIPSCYRVHFPEHLKSHRSHDIVLVCVDCHEIAHAAAEKYKRQVAAEFGIPLFIRKVVVDFDKTQNTTASSSFPVVSSSDEIGVSPLHLRTAAMALLRHGPQMPSERHEELMQIVRTYYGGREISNEDLERALLVGMTPHERRRFEKKRGFSFKHLPKGIANLDDVKETNITNPDESVDSLRTNMTETDEKQDYVDNLMEPADDRDISVKHESKLSLLGHGPHGKQVVMHLLKEYGEDGVRDFCQRWRQVFVEALHPRFLPGGWDVMHRIKRGEQHFLTRSGPMSRPRNRPAQGQDRSDLLNQTALQSDHGQLGQPGRVFAKPASPADPSSPSFPLLIFPFQELQKSPNRFEKNKTKPPNRRIAEPPFENSSPTETLPLGALFQKKVNRQCSYAP
ncbi:exosome complex exonuclease rrp6 [Phtheirospermum japonicum]|uniref:Exosome complex exonuclease rrp6 n=1 Tax=Phtheirospermum japonicum TaxID=374723 RepID=A0A830B4V3_9LAMI|nr:exosome complex exonuclease rrp6 [Phtheirospermum japonicum]